MFEQEICFESSLFIRSLKSTWSYNIFARREIKGNAPTLNVFELMKWIDWS